MNHMRRFLFFLLTYLLALQLNAQTDSCHIQISLLTCGPGEDLYSIFGHTAIRIVDSNFRTDNVYNYGTFDDSDPYFYLKFTRGIMLYSLSVEPLPYFMEEYRMEHRSVTEQILQLSCRDKLKLLAALQLNAQENNRFYSYHFYQDNCTLRAREIIRNNTSVPVTFKKILAGSCPSFRQLIHSYLDRSHKYWEKFGIDILMGGHLDKTVNNEEAMFLPDYLMKGFDSAFIDRTSLVCTKRELLPAGQETEGKAWFTPALFFTAWLIIILSLSLIRAPWSMKLIYVFDFIFFLVIGLLGILMMFLWLGRIDTVCRNNMNIMWAIPTHTVIIFLRKKRKYWIRVYFLCSALLSAILLTGWKWWPQEFNSAVIPICFLVVFRAFAVFSKK